MCKRFSSVFGCIPLCTKIVYASYLLALLFMALCHVLFIVASFKGVLNLTLSDFFFTFGLIGILLVDVISAWGVWRLFVCHKKAGFWIAILSPCLNLMLLFAVIGLVMLICMMILGALISHMKIAQALKLGED